MPTLSPNGRRALVAALIGAWLWLTPGTASAQAITEVTTIPGGGWLVRPGDNLGAGASRLVEGPAVPPAGRGSLELSVTSTTDRALVTNQFGQPTPTTPRAFDGLTGSWSTFVPAGPAVESRAPSLRFEAFRDITNPVGTFTTVSVEASRQAPAQGPVEADTWQTWALDASTVVWQSDASDACPMAAPCTLAEFVTAFPNARWGTVQVGIGSGAPAGASYVDAVEVSVGAEAFAWDFELPADQRSSAMLGTVTPTATGGTVPVTLTASALAVDATTFTVTVGGTAQDITLQPGESQVLDIAVPFGTTPITVTSRGVTLVSGEASVTAPTTAPTTAPPTTALPTTAPAPPGPGAVPGSPEGTLPATGQHSGELGALGVGLVGLGVAVLGVSTALWRSRGATRPA